MISYPELQILMSDNWDKTELDKPGPLSVLKTIFYKLECNPDRDWKIQCQNQTFEFLKTSQQQWGHEIKRILKRYLIGQTTKKGLARKR